MSRKPDTYNRARHEILHYILQFSVAKYFGSKKKGYEHILHSVDVCWRGGVSDEKPPIGSLCILSSAPTTKWYLSWLVEYKGGGLGGNYLMKSVEDHSLCWWTNVGIYFFPLETTEQFSQWKWSDRQFEFYDRWLKATKRVDDYWTKPLLPIFFDDFSVEVGTREHIFMTLGEDGYRPTKKFPDWRKVKLSELVEFFKYASTSKPKKEKQDSPPKQ